MITASPVDTRQTYRESVVNAEVPLLYMTRARVREEVLRIVETVRSHRRDYLEPNIWFRPSVHVVEEHFLSIDFQWRFRMDMDPISPGYLPTRSEVLPDLMTEWICLQLRVLRGLESGEHRYFRSFSCDPDLPLDEYL